MLSQFKDQNYLKKNNYNLLDYQQVITRLPHHKYPLKNFEDYFMFTYHMRNCYLFGKDIKHLKNIVLEIPNMERDIKWEGKCTCREYFDSKNSFKNGIKDISTATYNLVNHEDIRIISEKQLSEIIPITLFTI
jgi:hypothetical protein